MLKTSAVLVSAGESDEVYPSLEALPPDLRKKLKQAIEGPNAETIWIADEAGRERIFQAILRLPPEMQKKVLATVRGLPAPPAERRAPGRFELIALLAALVLLAAWLAWIWFF